MKRDRFNKKYRPIDGHKSMPRVLGIVTGMLLVINLMACASAYPLAGAVVVGSTTALISPPATGLGISAGWALGEMAKNDDVVEEVKAEAKIEVAEAKEEIIELKETVRALTTGDVEVLVKQGMAVAMSNAETLAKKRIATAIVEQRGFFDKLINELYALLKLLAILVVSVVVVHFGWTFYRSRRGEAYYKQIEQIKETISK